MEHDKARRQANWTMEECLFLISEVKEGFAVVKGKFGPSLNARMKKDRWETISRDLSAQFGSNRTAEQTEKKWSNLMAKAKPLISEYRRESLRTGGGPPPKPLDPVTQAIADLIGLDNVSVVGVTDKCDSSMLQFFDTSNTQRTKPISNVFGDNLSILSNKSSFLSSNQCQQKSLESSYSHAPMEQPETAVVNVYQVEQSDHGQPRADDMLLSIVPQTSTTCNCCKEIHDLKVQKLKLQIELLKRDLQRDTPTLKRKHPDEEE